MQGLSGMRILTAGLVTAVLGGLFYGFYHFYDAQEFVFVIGLGLMAVGGLGFVAGFFLLIFALRDPVGVHAQDANASFTALVRCMVAMSIVDGRLDKNEAKTITRIYELLTGEELEEEFVSEIADAMQNSPTVLHDELMGIRPILTNDLKEKIIKASFYILAADGVVEKNEERLLEDIRHGLDYPKMRYMAMKKDFFASRKNLRHAK
ncbi:MAG: TerB family tellurite resistance protein [Alphaproteobacteria bacterium]|nr:TerB family tellurite resistance protein [Alphaproteobacteria bacterium]